MTGASIAGHTTTTESFTQLGTKGNHATILELAERTGIDSVTANINAQDLMALGNAARFSENQPLQLRLTALSANVSVVLTKPHPRHSFWAVLPKPRILPLR